MQASRILIWFCCFSSCYLGQGQFQSLVGRRPVPTRSMGAAVRTVPVHQIVAWHDLFGRADALRQLLRSVGFQRHRVRSTTTRPLT